MGFYPGGPRQRGPFADQAVGLTFAREGNNTQAGSIALGVAGAILFWPALVAMDFKDASGKEAASLQ